MELNRYIDHTLLKADATPEQIAKLCAEAKEYRFASVCVNSCYVPLAAKLLSGTDTKVCCVVGFPLGACLSEAKAAETRLDVEAGAEEVDMVINIGALKSGNADYVENEIKTLKEVCGDKCLKVIIETCLLTEDEKKTMCRIVSAAGADYIKTSTGFSNAGATHDDIKLFKKYVSPSVKIKAAGGIHTLEDAAEFLSEGDDRLGTSAIVGIAEKELDKN